MDNNYNEESRTVNEKCRDTISYKQHYNSQIIKKHNLYYGVGINCDETFEVSSDDYKDKYALYDEIRHWDFNKKHHESKEDVNSILLKIYNIIDTDNECNIFGWPVLKESEDRFYTNLWKLYNDLSTITGKDIPAQMDIKSMTACLHDWATKEEITRI